MLIPADLHSQASRADEYSHFGIVRDRASGKPLEATVRAFASTKGRTNSGGCTFFEDPIQDTESDPVTGRFTVIVQRDLRSFVISYCRNGYIARTETTNSNLADGTPVKGDPIALFPENVNETAYLAALRAELTRSASELVYMSAARPDYYDRAIQRLRDDGSFIADPFQKRLLETAAGARTRPPSPPAGFQVN